MRVNHAYGDYSGRRGENIGDSDFELLRLNVDLDYNGVIGRAEYRYYDDYGMMHTAWLGYASDDYGTFKAGIVRVPFGPGPYGVSSSWFFDQHYYVGLADDMDLGARWTKAFGDLTVDLGLLSSGRGALGRKQPRQRPIQLRPRKVEQRSRLGRERHRLRRKRF